MKRNLNVTICLLLLNVQILSAQETNWDVADKNVVRLAPDSFPELPENIRAYLTSSGYTIPQSYFYNTPHNVIKGNFSSPTQTDWAILASKDRVSSILIFWNGSLDKVSSIAEARDFDYLQDVGDNEIRFSRLIEVITKNEIPDRIKKMKENRGVIKDYDGIEDHFLDKTSTIRYYSKEAWYSFIGVD